MILQILSPDSTPPWFMEMQTLRFPPIAKHKSVIPGANLAEITCYGRGAFRVYQSLRDISGCQSQAKH